MKTWILVADEARARVFEAARGDGELAEVADFIHDAGRHHPQERFADRLPRAHESSGSARHAIEPRTDAETVEARRFAQRLCDVLDAARNEHRYARLVLLAPPRFLGTLRDTLDAQVAKLVVAEVDKDLTQESAAQLHARVVEYL
jgi:protein required for attachment to host cells